MAQTTAAMAFTKAKVYVSADGTTWVDVSGHGASVAVEGGERNSATQNTFSGDTPLLAAGDRTSVRVTVRYVYTEEADEPFEAVRAIHETVGGKAYVQYTVKDGFWFKTGAGILLDPGYPGGEAGSGDIVMNSFIVECTALEKAAASS